MRQPTHEKTRDIPGFFWSPGNLHRAASELNHGQTVPVATLPDAGGTIKTGLQLSCGF